ncbi:unnamed protein product [Cyprideis torosa]|uniref:GTP cyclohydrolase 1 feedback regulatory protein n=1 Tax=Cyprideis torosa TaxID=163714 RepID=A0A7R8W853_9CRUS|nr:unnamed protein product [Cyprideis torosa]CAG0883085.1 unnamed protein product [Cyprideis torosa]
MISSPLPVSHLHPSISSWSIKVRVVHKSSVQQYSNSSGMGEVINVHLRDRFGDEIRATLFNRELRRFNPLLETNHVYVISGGKIKPANRKFNSLNSRYEIVFTHDTIVALAEGSSEIPSVMRFEFRNGRQIIGFDDGALVDTIAVCQTIGRIMERNGQKFREIQLVDESLIELTMTVWQMHAELFERPGVVVAVKGAKVTSWKGVKKLSCTSDTRLQLNPDIEESRQLQLWEAEKIMGKTSEEVAALQDIERYGDEFHRAFTDMAFKSFIFKLERYCYERGFPLFLQKGFLIACVAMPYVIFWTRNRIDTGPCYVGDEDADPELMMTLGAVKVKEMGDNNSVYKVDYCARVVLNRLETAGYKFLSCSGVGQTCIFTMQKP